MADIQDKKEVPGWALPVVIILGVILLGYVGYRAFTGASVPTGPPKQVRPGMVDFRKEAQNGNIGHKH